MERGADLDRLRNLASEFRQKSGNLRDIISSLTNNSEDSVNFWSGPKADQFRAEWQEVKPTFDSFADALDQAASNADTNANNIEAAT